MSGHCHCGEPLRGTQTDCYTATEDGAVDRYLLSAHHSRVRVQRDEAVALLRPGSGLVIHTATSDEWHDRREAMLAAIDAGT